MNMVVSQVVFLLIIATVSCCNHGNIRGPFPEECGSSNPNGNTIDQSEPESPGPFHDLTTRELRELRTFLENDPNIKANKSSEATVASSYIFKADLFLPPKADVLKHLSNDGPQPARQARVVMFRGDLSPPVVEEYICGPLDDIEKCELLNLPNRRNPVPFEIRPYNGPEFGALVNNILREVDQKIGFILRESYNATFTDCDKASDCLSFNPMQISTALLGNSSRQWALMATHNVPFYSVLPLDMYLLIHADGSDVSQWFVSKVWYAGCLYNSLDELVENYTQNSIPVQRVPRPVETDDLYSTLHRRGDPQPPRPQRPPTLVEPDGKRYSLHNKKVTYLDWEFNLRASHFSGPALYDVRFKGERIAYELALSEVAVLYSGNSPLQNTDYVDSGAQLAPHPLVPGADCPETATMVKHVYLAKFREEPVVTDAAFCLFENNNGHPLRRHLQNKVEGFYGGMFDSALTLRSILVVGNYDYILDFIFHQNGVLETRVMSTGYILASTYTEMEEHFGFEIHDHILGNLHLHMISLKADLDIKGTENRYETLDIVRKDGQLAMYPDKPYAQTEIVSNLKKTEQEALYKYNFDEPRYHIVYNNEERTECGVPRSFRLQVNGMAKNLFPEDKGNEGTMAWARHQIVVTKQKDEEIRASSIYGMFDGGDPVTNFPAFYGDNETIVDEDLVFWVSLGMHHIPHTEDFPVTPTPGNHLGVFFLPYNYFDECPSMGSRDALYIRDKESQDIVQGVTLNRYGNSRDQCILPKSTLEEDLEGNPTRVLNSMA